MLPDTGTSFDANLNPNGTIYHSEWSVRWENHRITVPTSNIRPCKCRNRYSILLPGTFSLARSDSFKHTESNSCKHKATTCKYTDFYTYEQLFLTTSGKGFLGTSAILTYGMQIVYIRIQPHTFQYTDGTDVSYYLLGVAVSPPST